MPGFKKKLSDQQIATLGAYLLQYYGNPKAQISAAQVKTLRAGGAPANLLLAARLGIAALFIVIIAALFALARPSGHPGKTGPQSTASDMHWMRWCK